MDIVNLLTLLWGSETFSTRTEVEPEEPDNQALLAFEEKEIKPVEKEWRQDIDFDSFGPDIHDNLKIYLAEIGRRPLLTGHEEIELAKRLEAGDKSAREELVERNLRLVVWAAQKHQGRGLDILDLIQAGNEGVVKAADRFDWRREVKFSTYAMWWIIQGINRAITHEARSIRLPRNILNGINKVKRTRMEAEGRLISNAELAKEMGIETEEVEMLMRMDTQEPSSLNIPVGEDKDGEAGDFIEDKEAADPEEETLEKLLSENVQEALRILPERYQEILDLRYGLSSGETLPLEEVGRKKGISKERVRQIERASIRKLNKPEVCRKLSNLL